MTSESIGPYRVLSRRLDGGVERILAEAPGGSRVVLRRRGSGSAGRSPVAEAVAFARADHPHVAPLVDVLTSASGELVLVFEDLGGDPLASWLAARGRPEPGEAITLVVPVLDAVQHLARRGTAIGALDVDDVEIDARGAPVLVGVRQAAAGPDAERASLPVAAQFARAVVERAARPASRDSMPTLDATSFESLVESVFDLGEAVPLSSVDDVVEGVDDGLGGDPHVSALEDEPVMRGWLALLPESEALDRVIAGVRDLRPRQVFTALGAVRRRYRLLAAGAVVVAGAAVVLGTASSARHDGSDDRVSTVSAGAESSKPGDPAGDSPGTVTTAPSRSGGTGSLDEVEALVVGDDAGAAAEVLLAARLECLRDVTPSCLDAVDQPGSPIALRDAAVLDDPSLAGGATVALELTGGASRAGGTVVLEATGPHGEPASVLVMRTEAGWRLRDVFVDR
ncbi:hypothetical protein [Frigoribacterium sp. MCBA15_019]|uniref:hypothetical protein n=1 Tax=Frigoribacterium sp. MCBA15_019 TaxID=1898745 RepID=UPI0008DE48CA|nr:hypothetical protein [Frigoribacterium sp. MCBA15_019]OII27247.1 hypothetical protein BIV04_01340 [Frigoribacterium sp. MCBA15_019]